MYNKIILLGNLSKDIEIRYSQGGSAIGNTAIATTRKFKGADGTQKEEVLFIDVAFFGRTAEVANQYLHKGSKVLLDGRLKLDQWTDKQGNKRSKHSVSVESLQMLDSKQADGQSASPHQEEPQDKYAVSPEKQAEYYRNHPSNAQATSPNLPNVDEMDEIPF